MTYFNRQIEQSLVQMTRTFPCLVLTGARQAGKTTLLRHLFPDHALASLDLPSEAEQAETDPENFFSRYREPLVIDEVQYAPGLFRHLKRRIDQDRHKMGRFILTGSQKFVLMQNVSDSLAGRAAITHLENLSANELSLETSEEWPRILARGFFPELWRLPELDAHSFYASYVATYLERDVRQVVNVQNLRDFERFLRACAVRSGQLLNMSDLARDVGIKPQTARDWLSVLEATNQVSLLEPYFENIGKRLVKSPKLYLNDPGMLCFLLGLDASTLLATPLVGLVWETFVYAEFRKRLNARPSAATLWFYRDAQGREIDLVEMIGGRLNLFEVKWTDDASSRWVSLLEEAGMAISKSKTQRIGEKVLLCRTPHARQEGSVQILHPIQFFAESQV